MIGTRIDDDPTPRSDPAADPPRAPQRTARRTDTRNPHRSRERALKILFQADVRGVSPQVTLQRLTEDAASREILDAVDDLTAGDQILKPVIDGAEDVELVSVDHGGAVDRDAANDRAGSQSGGVGADDASALDGFTLTLVTGVDRDRVRIDELIGRFARKWQVSRMPVVDRNVLRLATYELISEATSPAIVIDEAVGLAKAMSTDDSGRYVNGVLESVRRHLAEHPLPPLAADDGGGQVGGDDDGGQVGVGVSGEALEDVVDVEIGAEGVSEVAGDDDSSGSALDIALQLLDDPGGEDATEGVPSAEPQPADESDQPGSWSSVRDRRTADQPSLFEPDADGS